MNLLNEVLARPSVITHWGAREWNAFLPLARNARLLGRCRALFAAHDLADGVPQRVDDHLRGALTQTHYVQGQARRELRHVARCLAREGIQLMALKGLAYLVAGLPPSGWRNLSDIDLMVRRADIERAEQLLHTCGWVASGEHDTYDEHYYRDWMHEVPPLRHPARAVEVDVHHNLSPPVSRTQIDADKLWDAASEYTDEFGTRVFVLESADLLLHNAIHLFMNDELRGDVRAAGIAPVDVRPRRRVLVTGGERVESDRVRVLGAHDTTAAGRSRVALSARSRMCATRLTTVMRDVPISSAISCCVIPSTKAITAICLCASSSAASTSSAARRASGSMPGWHGSSEATSSMSFA